MGRDDRDRVHTLSLIAGMVPANVRKQIDQDELDDRIVEAAKLLERSNSATSPTLAKGYGEMAQAVLAAQPRRVTSAQIRSLLAKSAEATTADIAEHYRALAEEVRVAHPMAPRRRPVTLAKAAAEGLVAVFDANGSLVGVCDPATIQPVTSADARNERRQA